MDGPVEGRTPRSAFITGLAWTSVAAGVIAILAAVAHLAGAAAPFLAGPAAVDAATGLVVLLSIVLAVLFGWLVKRLLSDGVRREFRAPGQAGL